jgi:hypothetical protein
MFDWVPLPIYTAVYYHLMMFIVVLVGIHAASFDLRDKQKLSGISGLAILLFIFILLYMGLRPISGRYFGDMASYARYFENYQNGLPRIETGDWLFHTFMWLSAQVMSVKAFFLIVDLLYILPMCLFSKKHFKHYWAFCFILFLASFSFWTYGTNGLRNGLATSFLIWGLVYYKDRKILMYLFFALGFFMHASLIIPLAAFMVSYFLIKHPKYFFYIWLTAIPLSLAGGSTWNTFFENLGFLEDRAQGYLVGGEEFEEYFSQTGFRWDFLLYSATGVFSGFYFIIKKKLKDTFYIHLFGIYAISNAFWILVITAAFSNRFAYLSWFLLAPVIIYPLCKYQIEKNQYKVLGAIVFLYFLFTYVMFMK